jgi:hypothetical protein
MGGDKRGPRAERDERGADAWRGLARTAWETVPFRPTCLRSVRERFVAALL